MRLAYKRKEVDRSVCYMHNTHQPIEYLHTVCCFCIFIFYFYLFHFERYRNIATIVCSIDLSFLSLHSLLALAFLPGPYYFVYFIKYSRGPMIILLFILWLSQ